MSERPKRQTRTKVVSYDESTPITSPVEKRVRKNTSAKPSVSAVIQEEGKKEPVKVSIYQGRRSLSQEFGSRPATDTFHHPLSYGDTVQRSPQASIAIMNYGRFQPPTIGHGVLVQSIYEDSGSPSKTQADGYIFITPSCNDMVKYQKTKIFKEIQQSQEFQSCKQNENPLSAYQRTFYMKTMFNKDSPKVRFINCVEQGISGPTEAIKLLLRAGYHKIIFKCGSDRVPDFKFLEAMFQNKVVVQQAGAIRDEEGVITATVQPHQMSGTKMRLAAVEGKILSFKRGLMITSQANAEPDYIGYMTDDLALQMMNDIRDGLKTELKPLRMEELVQMGGKAGHRRRRFQTFVNKWIANH